MQMQMQMCCGEVQLKQDQKIENKSKINVGQLDMNSRGFASVLPNAWNYAVEWKRASFTVEEGRE